MRPHFLGPMDGLKIEGLLYINICAYYIHDVYSYNAHAFVQCFLQFLLSCYHGYCNIFLHFRIKLTKMEFSPEFAILNSALQFADKVFIYM